MSNHKSRMGLIGGFWLAAVAVILGCSAAAGATLSTTALLLALCLVPMGVGLLIGFGAAPPTVGELLYAVNNQKDGR